MVAALGHDLGKLKSARGSLYALGEHPLAAGAIISGIPGFKELSRKEDILRAIKMHHKMPEGLLGKALKKADQQELERWVGVEASEEITESHEEEAKEKPPQPSSRDPPSPLKRRILFDQLFLLAPWSDVRDESVGVHGVSPCPHTQRQDRDFAGHLFL